MSEKLEVPLDMLAIQEMQLVLAEKRTALSILRTGIAIFAFPLSVLSVLIATSKSYNLHDVMHWLVPLLLLNAALIVLAVYLIMRAFKKIHHYDRQIEEFKRQHSRLAGFIS